MNLKFLTIARFLRSIQRVKSAHPNYTANQENFDNQDAL